jgi:hypothetical protein
LRGPGWYPFGMMLKATVHNGRFVVEERLSVARTFKSRKVNIGGSSGSLALDSVTQFLLPPKWITEYETLKTEEQTWEDIDEEDSYVKSGDPVVQVLQDDDTRVLQRRLAQPGR